MFREFSNTRALSLFILRRDRVRLVVWILSISIFVIAIAAILPDLYTTFEERQVMAEAMENPAVTVMLGPGYGLDNYTDGAMMAHFMLVFSAIGMGIMNIMLVVRYTREDEEEGRTEMIRSLPTGSLSYLAASFSLLCLVNVLTSLLVGLGLSSLAYESMDLIGSLLYGAAMGAIGIFFAALTSLFAQLTSNARATIGYSFSFLIAAYIVRGIGDVGYELLSLISPLGLVLRTQVYVNNYCWPVFIILASSVLIFALSLYLNSIRDLGAGFIQTRPGRARASRLLLSPLGLAFRLQKNSIIAWTLGMLILGVSYGSILGDLEGFINSSELIRQMIPEIAGKGMTESFITMLMTILSILGTIPVLLFILRLKGEEKKGRTEQILAAAVSRKSLLASFAAIGLMAIPLIQLMSVLGLWSSAAFVMEDPLSFSTIIKLGLVHLPAMLFMAALAVVLIGFLPGLTGLVWLYLGYSFFVVYMGEMLKLPNWLEKLSPFGYIPQLPLEGADIARLSIMAGLAIALIVAGFIGYRQRDIQG